jgi:micrococcal nuclease
MLQSFLEVVTAVLLAVLVWVAGGQSPAPEGPATSGTSTVAFVIDGDTFALEGGERVRLLGIDTPERDECYYQEASDYLETLVTDRSIRLEADETDRDKYDRLLRYVFVTQGESEVHINIDLIEQGYAKLLSIPPDRRYRSELTAALVSAKAAGRGLWSACATSVTP